MARGGITILFFPPAAIGATTALSLKIAGSALMSGGIAGELRITNLIKIFKNLDAIASPTEILNR